MIFHALFTVLYLLSQIHCVLYNPELGGMRVAQTRWSIAHTRATLCAELLRLVYRRLTFTACHEISKILWNPHSLRHYN